MKKNTVKLNEQQLKKVIGESVKKVLKEWDDFKITDDFKLSDDMPFGTDKVTPGDSLPIISQAPRNDNRFNYFSDKEMLKLSIRNQIENKEGLKNSYSLKDLSKDIARRFKIDPVESFEMVKKIYKKIGGYHAIDENRIKIKESQLKKIVAESVKKVLSEIDWKTYANAMKKASEKSNKYGDDNYKKANRFRDAAIKSFNDEYGFDYDYNDNLGTERHGNIRMDDADSFDKDTQKWSHGLRLGKITSEPGGRFANYTWRSLDKKWDDKGEAYAGTEGDDEMDDVKNRWDAAKDELDNYRDDKYTYDNEKGWHLKESIDKAVKSVLKEYLNKKP